MKEEYNLYTEMVKYISTDWDLSEEEANRIFTMLMIAHNNALKMVEEGLNKTPEKPDIESEWVTGYRHGQEDYNEQVINNIQKLKI